jgi:chemotaxis methyl-accepting protein methylase
MGDLHPILDFVRKERKCNISAYNDATLQRCIEERLGATGSKNLREYLAYLQRRPDESDNLLDVLTINVSHFFRDTLTFEYIAQKVLPSLLLEKRKRKDRMIRIWSAGCAGGEEPYSIAIMVKNLIEEEDPDLKIMVFGTDVDRSALAKAREAAFSFEAVKHVKYEYMEKYFVRDNGRFNVVPEIKSLVIFSRLDLFDTMFKVPSDSVYGDFDMVFCRNVLIYFREEAQRRIIRKFHNSLGPRRYLVLGPAEEILAAGCGWFERVTDACPIFQKVAIHNS